MKFLVFVIAMGLSSLVHASPSSEILERITQSYNPHIIVRTLNVGFSFYGCFTRELEIIGKDPVTGQSRPVSVTFYQGRGFKKRPSSSVIILPPTGGVNILDRGYANELCWAGLDVALVSTWFEKEPQSIALEIHDQGAFRALAAVRHTVEFLKSRGSPAIGLLGTSIGAISGNLALGYEPRIDAAVLIVGSGRFAEVIVESLQADAAALRQMRMKSWGLKSQDEYRRAVFAAVKTNPVTFAHYSGPKDVFLVTADNDVAVPTAYQYELAEQLHPRVHLKMRGGHVEVIKEAFFSQRHKIVEFMRDSLSRK